MSIKKTYGRSGAQNPPSGEGLRATPPEYAFEIPSRERVIALLKERDVPVAQEDLLKALGIVEPPVETAMARRLRAMVRDGQIVVDRKERFGLPSRMDMVQCRVIAHPDGFGFAVPDEGGEDIFLSTREMQQVMDGDRLLVRRSGRDNRGRPEGVVIEVLERARTQIVGRFQTGSHMHRVTPLDPRLPSDLSVARDEAMGARDGQMVVAEIVEYPTRRTGLIGKLVEILGDRFAPGMEIEIAIRSRGIPHLWPEGVDRETEKLPPGVPPDALSGREDIRSLELVTIDGEDARDFDDAVFAEAIDKSATRLVVAIADVAHYVRPGTALESEAYRRGNSVYFPNRVVPMLPEALSNGLCSLNPKVDRLCMVCDMVVGAKGGIRSYRFYPAAMHSRARLTYTRVAQMLANPESPLRDEYADLVPRLEALERVYRVLHSARERRGAVDFDLPESRIIFGADRKIERVEPLVRNEAHRLIEECMLAANVCAAEYLDHAKMAVPFRIHERPPAEKLTDLREFLGGLGLSLGGGDRPTAKDYSGLLSAVQSRPDARLVQTVMLRSLAQAVYSPDNVGHFALGYERYTHFTSPIRRYPDLLVHRAIRAALEHRPGPSQADVVQGAAHCSMTERRADDATREVIRSLKCEFLKDRAGDTFQGLITGVTNFGLFVELSEILIDGLVHITSLGEDYFQFDPGGHRLIGEGTRKIYRLGDAITVRLVRVDLDQMRVDLVPDGEASEPASTRTRSSAPRPPKASRPPKGRRRR